jgi:hypothetical protein
MSDFSPKRAGESEVFTVDFAPLLAPGETVTSAAWSITPIDGQDPSAASMIVGAASVDGGKVSQMIGSGVPGVRYAPICTAQTSNGQTLILPEYGNGQLEVTL